VSAEQASEKAPGVAPGVAHRAAAAGVQAGGRRLLGQILKAQGVLREGQIQEALAEQRKQGGLIGQCLVQLGHCSSAAVARALAEQAGMESVDLSTRTPEKAALALIDGCRSSCRAARCWWRSPTR
jgi:hypothetical protein